MADLVLTNQNFTAENEVVTLHMEAVLDASGDVSSYVRQMGITSLVRGTAGQYVLTLTNKYNKFLHLWILWEKATAIGIQYQIASEAIAASGTVALRFFDVQSPPVAANPVSCTIHLIVQVKQADTGT